MGCRAPRPPAWRPRPTMTTGSLCKPAPPEARSRADRGESACDLKALGNVGLDRAAGTASLAGLLRALSMV